MPNSFDLLTVSEAAENLGLTAVRVRQFCQEGRLGRKVGSQWLISADELRSFSKIPREPGKPPTQTQPTERVV